MSFRFPLLVLLLPFAPLSLAAQEFKAGAFVAVVASQVDGDAMGGYHKFGYAAGLSVSRELGKHLSMEMQLLYIQKGSAPSGKGNGDGVYIYADYIDFELSTHYALTEYIQVKAGLVPGFCIHSSEASASGVTQRNAVAFRPFSFGAVVGMRYQMNRYFGLFMDFGYSALSIREGKLAAFDFKFAFQNGQFHNYMKAGIQYTF